jgi:hypothetical protein
MGQSSCKTPQKKKLDMQYNELTVTTNCKTKIEVTVPKFLQTVVASLHAA